MKFRKAISFILAFCILVSVHIGLNTQHINAAGPAAYLDAGGMPQTSPGAADLTPGMTTLATGWYIVSGNVTFTSRIVISGDVNIILADGALLDVSNVGIAVPEANSLTVYAQSAGGGMGAITASMPLGSWDAAIGGNGSDVEAGQNAGVVTINGGSITAVSANAAGIGGGGSSSERGGAGGVVIINGGEVSAASTLGAGIGGGASEMGIAGAGGTIIINGGIVSANSNSGAGIGGGSTYFGTTGAGGAISVNGGTVTATVIGTPNNVFYGATGAAGSFAMNGSAVVFAESFDAAGSKTSGILVMKNGATNWYGAALKTINYDITIPSGYTMTISAGDTLTVPQNRRVTVSGGAALVTQAGAMLVNNGTIQPADNSRISLAANTRSGNKIAGAGANPPVEQSKTGTGDVTLNTAALKANTGQVVEYAQSATPTAPADDAQWHESPVFPGLTIDATYYFFARSMSNADYENGPPSVYTAVIVKQMVPSSPPMPTFSAVTTNSITLNWTPSGGAPILGYTVYVSSAAGNPITSYNPPGSATTSYTVTGLNPGTGYIFQVQARGNTAAFNSALSPPTEVIYTAPGPAPAPTLGAVTANSIVVNWEKPMGEVTGYMIFASDGSTTSDLMVANVTSFVFTGLNPGTRYQFSVQALTDGNGFGTQSPWSAWKYTAPARPSAPTLGQVTANSAQLSWARPAGNEVLGYRIQTDGGAWLDVGNVLTYTVTGLSPDAEHSFRVIAYNSGGDSPASTMSAASTLLPQPAAPTVNSVSAAGIVVVWANMGLSYNVDGYQIQSNDGGGWSAWADVGGALTYTYTNLSPGTQYTFRINAYNGNGVSVPSAASAPAYTVPAAPAAPTTGAVTYNSVAVNWASPGNRVTGYKISHDGFVTWEVVNNGTAVTYNYTGLNPDTDYTFQVIAFNEGGDSAPSGASGTAHTLLPPPGAPVIDETMTASTAITVNWLPVSGADGYSVQLNNGVWTDAGNVLTYTFTGLQPAAQYTIRVRPYNSAGDGTASAPAAGYTLPDKPAAPTASASTASTITVNWASPGGTVTEYQIRAINGGDTSWKATTATSYTFTGLTPETGYTFEVRAVNAGGAGETSDPSAEKYTTIAAMNAPVPGAAASTSIALTWNAVGTAAGYKVSANNGAWADAGNVTAFSFAGLSPNTSYTFRVRAYNAYGDGDPSPASAAKTTALAAPPAPSVGSFTHNTAVITWSAVAGATGYIVRALNTNNGTWADSAVIPAGTLSTVIQGLEPDTGYAFMLIAVNANGNSNPSAQTPQIRTNQEPLPSVGPVIFDYPTKTDNGAIELRPVAQVIWNGSYIHTEYDSAYTAARSAAYNGYATNSHIVTDNKTVRFFGYWKPAYMDKLFTTAYANSFDEMTFTMRPMNLNTHTYAESGFLFNGSYSGNIYTGYALILDNGSLRLWYLDRVNMNPASYSVAPTGTGAGTRRVIGTYKTGISSVSTVPYNINILRNWITGGFKVYLDGALVADVPAPISNAQGFGFFTGYTAHGCSQLAVIQYENVTIAAGGLSGRTAATAHFINDATGETIAQDELHSIGDYGHGPYAGDFYYVKPPQEIVCRGVAYEYVSTDLKNLDPVAYKINPGDNEFNLYYEQVPLVPAAKTASVNGGPPESGTAANPVRVSVGDTIQYTVTLDNTQDELVMTADPAQFGGAYPFTLTDALPPGLTYVPGSARILDAGGAPVPPDTAYDGAGTGITDFGEQNGTLTWQFTQIPPGTQTRFIFSAAVEQDQDLFGNRAVFDNKLDIAGRTNYTYHTTSYTVTEKYRSFKDGSALQADTATRVQGGDAYEPPMSAMGEITQLAGDTTNTWRYYAYSIDGGATKTPGAPDASVLADISDSAQIIYYFVQDVPVTIYFKNADAPGGPDLKPPVTEEADGTLAYFMPVYYTDAIGSLNYTGYKLNGGAQISGPVPGAPDGTFTAAQMLAAGSQSITLYFKNSYAVTVQYREYLNDVNILRSPFESYLVSYGDSFDAMARASVSGAVAGGVVSPAGKLYSIYRGWSDGTTFYPDETPPELTQITANKTIILYFSATYDITEKFHSPVEGVDPDLTVTTVVSDITNTRVGGETIIGTPPETISDGVYIWQYVGYKAGGDDNNPLIPGTPYIDALAGDMTIIYVYEIAGPATGISVLDRYRALNNTGQILAPDETREFSLNEAYTGGAQTIRGWEYVGWSLDNESIVHTAGEQPGSAGALSAIKAPHTVTYLYIPIPQYSVVCLGNGNTGGSAPLPETYYRDETATIPGPGDMVKQYYTFVGWAETQAAANAVTPDYAYNPADGSFMPADFTVSQNVLLYAVWQENDRFTVTYYGNGNTGGNVPADTGGNAAAASNMYYINSAVSVLPPGALVKENHSFLGWALTQAKADQGAADYVYNRAAGTLTPPNFTITANTELFAVWGENRYTLSYNGNGSTGGTAPAVGAVDYLENTEIALQPPGDLVKAHFQFKGWAASAAKAAAGAPDYVYNPETGAFEPGSFSIMGDTVLYAVWAEDPIYTVTYNGNGSTGGVPPADKGGDAPAGNNNYYEGTEVSILGPGGLFRQHYTFLGWALTQEKAGADTPDFAYDPEDGSFAPAAFTPTGNTTLYAVWLEHDQCAVTYYGNGNTGGAAPQDTGGNAPAGSNFYYVGSTVNILPPGAMARQYYTFVGWALSQEGADAGLADYAYNGTGFTPGGFTAREDVMLYAVWSEHAQLTVTYDGNGSTGGAVPLDTGGNAPAGSNVYYVNSAVVLSGPGDMTRQEGQDQYIFIGWATTRAKADAQTPDFAYDGTKLAPAQFTITQSAVLYASWRRFGPFTVTYRNDGADNGSAIQDPNLYYLNGNVTITGNADLRKKGYELVGWATGAMLPAVDPAKPATYYRVGDVFAISDDMVFYPVWRVNNYSVNDLDFTELNNMINEAKKIPADKYTPQSYGEMISQYQETIYNFYFDKANIATLSQLDIDDAAKALRGAIDALVRITYTITYDGGAYTQGTAPAPASWGKGDTAALAGPGDMARQNYTFMGWATSPEDAQNGAAEYPFDGTGFGGGSPALTGNITLYAVWEESQIYAISFDGGGNTGGSPPETAQRHAGTTFAVPGPDEMVKYGYSFMGWAASPEDARNGVAEYTYDNGVFSPQSFTVEASRTLYAVWRAGAPFTVTYINPLAPQDVPAARAYDIDSVVPLGLPSNISPEGYVFLGWAYSKEKADAGTPDYAYSGGSFDVGAVTVAGDAVLWAVWQKTGPFTVTYAPDGATGGAPPQDGTAYYRGDTFIVAGNSADAPLVRTGYMFVGWAAAGATPTSINPDDPSTYYPAGSTISITDDTVLCPVWKELDFSYLDNVIDKIASTPKNQYTPESWKPLGDLYQRAIDDFYYNIDSINALTQDDIDKMAKSLGDALGALAKAPPAPPAPKPPAPPASSPASPPAVQTGGSAVSVTNAELTGGLSAGQPPAVRPGESVSYTARFTNKGDTTMYNVKLTYEINGQVYDHGTIDVLRPGETKEIGFTYKVPDDAAHGTVIRAAILAEYAGVTEKYIYEPVAVGWFVSSHIWYIRGYTDNTIRPRATMTRAEVAVALYRLLDPELKTATPTSVFNDVSGDKWYALAIDTLASRGILNGYTDGSFRPDRPITRSEMAVIVSRFDKLPAADANPYSDVNSGSWAYHDILAATQAGWFIGGRDGLFRPSDNITRAEFVTVVNRVLDRHILPADLPGGLRAFRDLSRAHWAYADFMEAVYSHEYTIKADGINETWTKITGHGFEVPYNQ